MYDDVVREISDLDEEIDGHPSSSAVADRSARPFFSFGGDAFEVSLSGMDASVLQVLSPEDLTSSYSSTEPCRTSMAMRSLVAPLCRRGVSCVQLGGE